MDFLPLIIGFLAAAVLIVPLAQRVGLGAIVGYLLVGVALGPAGFGWVGDVHSVALVSELGIVLMLFVIGLELELLRLWAMRLAVFGYGSLQMLVCGALLAAGSMLLGVSWQAAIIIGFAASISSTAITVNLLTQRGLMSTGSGSNLFGIILFQDVSAIPLLLLVAILAPATLTSADVAPPAGPGWTAIAALFAVIVIGRLMVRPILRLIAAAGQREVFTAASLLLVLSVAYLMSSVGLSMGLGAFLAGVLLADSEYKKVLEADIEPFKGLLLGLFFASVGMGIDLGVVVSEWATVLAVTFGFIALKTLSLALVAPWVGIEKGLRLQLSVLMAQAGEFTFVLIASTRSVELLTAQQASLLNAAASLSMASTPLLFSLTERWAARRQTQPSGAGREADSIDDDGSAVIVAGFGRVGQIVTRVLLAAGIKPTVLEYDPAQVETLRGFGFKVYYGDATRLDLLEAAGAQQARLIVVAVDDPDVSIELVDTVQQHFPQLEIVARARNVQHAYKLMDRGVKIIERETFEASLKLARASLHSLGVDRFEARRIADRFRRHGEELLVKLHRIRDDAETLRSEAKQARASLEASMNEDRELLKRHHGQGW